MALPTYISLVNNVLVRMREPEVNSVNENTLSKLVGILINDTKRQVEDAYNWNALTDTLIVDTVAGTYGYTLNGSGQRFKVIDVQDVTNKRFLTPVSTNYMSSLLINSPGNAQPAYYNFNGVHSTGDTKVDLYPIPDGSTQIYFNMYIPQADLVNDGDVLWVPDLPVVLGAFARALVERGEDGGLNSSEAYAQYRSALSDAIATESSRFIEEETWEAN